MELQFIINGDLAGDIYKNLHFYDKDGIIMSSSRCEIKIVDIDNTQIKDKKCKAELNNVDGVKVIDSTYKVLDDAFYINNYYFDINQTARKARKLIFTKGDIFEYKKDLYFPILRENMAGEFSSVSSCDKHITDFYNVYKLTGDFRVKLEYWQYLSMDYPICDFSNSRERLKTIKTKHKAYCQSDIEHKLTNHTLYLTTFPCVRSEEDEYRKMTKDLTKKIQEKCTFRFKNMTYYDIESLLEHFDIIEK